MNDKFSILIESLHVADTGEQENVRLISFIGGIRSFVLFSLIDVVLEINRNCLSHDRMRRF